MKVKLKNKVLEVVKLTELNFAKLKEKYPIARLDRTTFMVRNDAKKDFLKFQIGSYLDVTDPKDIIPYPPEVIENLTEKGEEDD